MEKMPKFSKGQLKALSEFFNTIATAWFSGGVIAPFFAKVGLLEKLIFFVFGAGFAYVFLSISLFFAQEING